MVVARLKSGQVEPFKGPHIQRFAKASRIFAYWRQMALIQNPFYLVIPAPALANIRDTVAG
jgi:hypothetical protein